MNHLKPFVITAVVATAFATTACKPKTQDTQAVKPQTQAELELIDKIKVDEIDTTVVSEEPQTVEEDSTIELVSEISAVSEMPSTHIAQSESNNFEDVKTVETIKTGNFVEPAVDSASSQQIKPVATKSISDLQLTVKNLKANSGNLIIAVYDNANAFNQASNDVYSALSLKVAGSTMTVTLNNVPKGKYAVSVFQDTNRNGNIDMNGDIPTEGYGFSNNVGKMSIPTFDDAGFNHSKNNHVILKLIQPA